MGTNGRRGRARASNGNNSMRRYEGSRVGGGEVGGRAAAVATAASAAPLILIPRQRRERGRGWREDRRREAPLTLEIDAPLVLEQPAQRRVVVAVVRYYVRATLRVDGKRAHQTRAFDTESGIARSRRRHENKFGARSRFRNDMTLIYVHRIASR